MQAQIIRFSGARDASTLLATLEDDVSIDTLGWDGRTMPVRLADDHAAQPHLIDGDRIVRVVVGEADDVEAHTLSLRFPSAEEAARFRAQILAGTLLVGALAVPIAVGASSIAAGVASDDVVAPIVEPARWQAIEQAEPATVEAVPVKDTPEEPGFTIQSRGTTEVTGEDNDTGSSIMWNTRTQEAR
jgi:hypothetical protein